MTTATAKTVAVFCFEFKPSGTFKTQTMYVCGFTSKDATTRARKMLRERLGTRSFELGEAVECADADLPQDEGLYASLARQREQLCPTPAPINTGNIWLLYAIREGSRTEQKLWVLAKSESEARAKAEARLSASDTGDGRTVPLVLRPHFKQLTVDQAEAELGMQVGVFSVLTADDAAELVHSLREEYREQLVRHHQQVLKVLTDSRGGVIPATAPAPRPGRFLRQAESYSAEQAGGDVSAGINTEPAEIGV